MLEASRGIRESKWHEQIFEKTEGCTEGCLPFFTFFDSNEVIGAA